MAGSLASTSFSNGCWKPSDLKPIVARYFCMSSKRKAFLANLVLVAVFPHRLESGGFADRIAVVIAQQGGQRGRAAAEVVLLAIVEMKRSSLRLCTGTLKRAAAVVRSAAWIPGLPRSAHSRISAGRDFI
jgi:hypothetical protein